MKKIKAKINYNLSRCCLGEILGENLGEKVSEKW